MVGTRGGEGGGGERGKGKVNKQDCMEAVNARRETEERRVLRGSGQREKNAGRSSHRKRWGGHCTASRAHLHFPGALPSPPPSYGLD